MLGENGLPEGLEAKFDATKYAFFDLGDTDGGLEEDDGLGGLDDDGAEDDILPPDEEEVEEVEITNDDDDEDLSFTAAFAARMQLRGQQTENSQGVSGYASPDTTPAKPDQGFADRVQQHHQAHTPLQAVRILAVNYFAFILIGNGAPASEPLPNVMLVNIRGRISAF
eukprot:1194391-Prorocentrum_minimum.AAC.3